jgi:putative tryptophan/tyrosine transport system substrate-binding protein
LAAELVTLKVDVIVAGATPAARAAKRATSTIPVVAVAMGDPVGDELVASLGSPGANVTGNTFLGPELVAKRLQLFRDAVFGFFAFSCDLAPWCIRRTHNAGLFEGD